MALVGALSTQLLHQMFVAQVPKHREVKELRTDIDLVLNATLQRGQKL
jgi:hypothetical protein